MRALFFFISISLLTITFLGFYLKFISPLWFFAAAAISVVGVCDILQKRRTILRNFPIFGHFRYLFEMFRPEMQQYFIEEDSKGAPISRIYRSVVYQKSKAELDTVAFGSQLDFYNEEYEWVNHSSYPKVIKEHDIRVNIGGPQCTKPYSASLFNISAMSFGALSKTAISALGKGAQMGNFYINTGEGGISPYHIEGGSDIVWQIGTAYFGCRDEAGLFSEKLFELQARREQVKMIEIKLSQGAKPGHGGVLPGVKVSEEIAAIRHVPVGKTVISPPYHSTFSNSEELCSFIQKLRELSGGKPVGFKLCLGKREEFIHICEAIKKTNIFPDFISIDGGEGGTGAAPFDFINYVGSPLDDALYFVDSTLKKYGFRKDIKVIASGKVFTAYNLFKKIALGADLCNSARGMMLALGCIQALRCNTNHCPTGIATNLPRFYKGLDVTQKSVRVFNYHKKTLESFAELLGACGLTSSSQINRTCISRRLENRILTLEEFYSKTSELSKTEKLHS